MMLSIWPLFLPFHINYLQIFMSYNLIFKIGMDLIGPMKASTAGMVYIMTVTYYYTKWAEAKAIPSKHAVHVAAFLYELFCR